jgi:GDP-L-fucose synthase
MSSQPKIFVAGHRGMVGSAIVRALHARGHSRLVVRTHEELELTNQQGVMDFFAREQPDLIYLAAARVGGIHANNAFPAEFIYSNLMVQANVIHAAYVHSAQRLLFLGSSCIYPKHASQPMSEDALLTGPLEPTNEPYAVAKIAGIKMCESYNRQYGTDFRSVMPTNLYGPGDTYHPENSHVVPSLIQRVHDAKARSLPEVAIWGTGRARREFLHVDDMAQACVHVMELDRSQYDGLTQPQQSHLNVGFGADVAIAELATAIAQVVGYEGAIRFDPDRPDGTPRKLLDSDRLRSLGWSPRIELAAGLRDAYADYLARTVQKEVCL